MKAKRYFYVGARVGRGAHTAHLCYGRTVEGEATVCGRFLQPGWSFWFGRARVPKTRTVCPKCTAGR